MYRKVSSIIVILVADESESELGLLDLIQVLMDILEESFDDLREYDLVYNIDRVHSMFDEVIMGGMVLETNVDKIMATIIHVLYKLRIVKNRYATMKKTVRDLREYSEAIRMFTRKTAQMIPLILLSIAETFLYLAIPFFVVIAIADVPPTAELLVQILCLSVITRYTSLLLPTPGNTGAVEATSSLIFITVAGIDAYLGWVVLVWRFLTYYIYILSGIGINIFEIIRSAVRSRRQRHISGSPPPEQDASE